MIEKETELDIEFKDGMTLLEMFRHVLDLVNKHGHNARIIFRWEKKKINLIAKEK